MALTTEQPSSGVTPVRPGLARPRAKRQRRACIECHQAKLRCDAPITPCTRCRHLGLECRVDQDYKRVSKNDKIKNLEREIHQLRSNHDPPVEYAAGVPSASTSQGDSNDVPVGTVMPSPSPGSGRVDYSISTPQRALMGDELVSDIQDQPLPLVADDEPLHPAQHSFTGLSPPLIKPAANSPYSIGSVQLSNEQVNFLFEQYFGRFHPYLDILDERISPDQYYAESPLLFWTIIVISARRYHEDASLLPSLSPALTTLLWSTISLRPHSWHTVASIVLQVAWPLPASTPFVENSYLLAGIAVQAAIQLGLHQPESIQDFSRTKAMLSTEEISRRARVWAACNIVAQSTCTILGYPPVGPFHWTVHRCCEPGSIYSPSINLRHRLIVERFTHRVTSVLMERQPYPPEAATMQSDLYSLINMLEKDWEEINAQCQQDMSAYSMICLMGARLHLFLHSFFQPLNLPTRREGLLKAYMTALDLIALVDTDNESSKLLLYGPALIYNLLILACFTIMKLLRSSLSDDLDGERGKSSFNRAIFALRTASVINNDVPGRSTEILARLWRGAGQSSPSRCEPSLRLRSRGSASVLHDEVWRYREDFMGQQNAYPPRRTGAASQPSRAGSSEAMNTIELGLFNNYPWVWEFDAPSEAALFTS